MGRLTSSLRLQLPRRHGDGCESAITNKNNPAAHVCTTCRSDWVPARFPSSRAQHSRELAQHGTPPEARMQVPIERQVWVHQATNPWSKGKAVCVNGTNPLRNTEPLFINVSCYSNELLLSPRETPVCPEASPPTRPSLLAWRPSPSQGRRRQPLPRVLRQREQLSKILGNVD